MKERLLRKKCKYTVTKSSNMSIMFIYYRDTVRGNSRYFLFIKIDCLKIRKTRREHHSNMCGRSELSEWKRRVSLVVPELFCIKVS